MRIAMIGQKGMPAIYGGVEQHVHELSVGLVRYGYDVTVYARKWYTGGIDTAIDGVTVTHIPTWKSKYFDTVIHTFLSTIDAMRNGFDVIHYHGVGPSLLSFIPRILCPKTRVIVTFHSIDRFQDKWGWFAKRMLKIGEWTATRIPNQTISVSKGLAKYCRDEYNREAVYIPNGVMEQPEPGDPKQLAQFGLVPGQYVTMISRLVPRKGVHILVDAFRAMKQAHPNDSTVQDLKLAIVGGAVGRDGYVEELTRRIGDAKDIVVTGFVSGAPLAALYANARALVHPSFNEGLPIAVLTAMNYGVPVLVSDIPEHLELVTDARCLFRENNVPSLAETLYRFLKMPLETQKAIAEKNRTLVKSDYRWDILIPRVAEVYEQRSSTLSPVTTRI